MWICIYLFLQHSYILICYGICEMPLSLEIFFCEPQTGVSKKTVCKIYAKQSVWPHLLSQQILQVSYWWSAHPRRPPQPQGCWARFEFFAQEWTWPLRNLGIRVSQNRPAQVLMDIFATTIAVVNYYPYHCYQNLIIVFFLSWPFFYTSVKNP